MQSRRVRSRTSLAAKSLSCVEISHMYEYSLTIAGCVCARAKLFIVYN
jgi:hypothetical protein